MDILQLEVGVLNMKKYKPPTNKLRLSLMASPAPGYVKVRVGDQIEMRKCSNEPCSFCKCYTEEEYDATNLHIHD